MTYTARLFNPQQAHALLADLWPKVKAALTAGHRLELTVKREKRTSEQNRLMWAALTDISQQVDWYGQKLSPGEWKDVITASLKRQKVVPGLDGGFVVLGSSTSKMTVQEMSEVLECALAFGASKGVEFAESD